MAGTAHEIPALIVGKNENDVGPPLLAKGDWGNNFVKKQHRACEQAGSYRVSSGNCPVEEFLNSLNDKQVAKNLWVLRLVRELDSIPKEYLKKLVNTDDIWEVRIRSGSNSFQILGFFDDDQFIVLTNGFFKKSQKTPKNEIALAQKRRIDYLEMKKNG